jgi:RNA polymerase sigma-70 factor, ECF subfamily
MQDTLLDDRETTGAGPEDGDAAPVMDPRMSAMVRSAAAGDRAAFEALINRYQGEIFRMVYYRILSRMDAEDITQDVFVKAFRGVGSIREPGMFKPWLYRIALNAINDFFRKKRLRSIFTLFSGEKEEGLASEDDHAPVHLERKEFWGRFDKFLARLSAGEKEVFRLKYLDELNIREISEALGKNESTVKTHLYRAVEKFRGEKELCALWRNDHEPG